MVLALSSRYRSWWRGYYLATLSKIPGFKIHILLIIYLLICIFKFYNYKVYI